MCLVVGEGWGDHGNDGAGQRWQCRYRHGGGRQEPEERTRGVAVVVVVVPVVSVAAVSDGHCSVTFCCHLHAASSTLPPPATSTLPPTRCHSSFVEGGWLLGSR